ncbi:unnamed protein product [Mesocestoides corti]|uniref:Reverse transcriptase domain-containing protein n=1 Tax=Mesocestoides corti TaxID=53468 RepID=A0A0R3UC34_MESCO|nr:unnamed protein product [Mesocestoides corti]
MQLWNRTTALYQPQRTIHNYERRKVPGKTRSARCLPATEDRSRLPCTANHQCPSRFIQYNRLLFGVNSAPAIFQQIMDSILAGIPGVAAYLDVPLIVASLHDELCERIEEVLQRIHDNGLRLRQERCQLFLTSVKYLGFIFDGSGRHPDPENIRAIQQMPTTKDVPSLPSFLGEDAIIAAIYVHESVTQQISQTVRALPVAIFDINRETPSDITPRQAIRYVQDKWPKPSFTSGLQLLIQRRDFLCIMDGCLIPLATGTITLVTDPYRLCWSDYSKWPEIDPMTTRTLQVLPDIFSQLGTPETITVHLPTLQGILSTACDYTHTFLTPPSTVKQTGGKFRQRIEARSAKIPCGRKNIRKSLQNVLLVHRTTPNEALLNRQSPSEALMGRKLRTTNFAMIPVLENSLEPPSTKSNPPFEMGALVYVRDYRPRHELWIEGTGQLTKHTLVLSHVNSAGITDD